MGGGRWPIPGGARGVLIMPGGVSRNGLTTTPCLISTVPVLAPTLDDVYYYYYFVDIVAVKTSIFI